MTQVTEVNYSDSGVMVVTYSGAQLHADHVLVTVPLTALKRHAIQFNPPLPDEKIHAIESFGIGVLEKVSNNTIELLYFTSVGVIGAHIFHVDVGIQLHN